MYTVIPNPQFTRDYKALPPSIQRIADKQIHLLRVNPRHPSLRTHKRRGEGDV